MYDPITAHELALARANLELARLNETRAVRLRDFRVHGISSPPAERYELEARIATAEAQKQAAALELMQAKADWRAGRRVNQYLALTQLLNERGLGDLIQQASRMADQHARGDERCGTPAASQGPLLAQAAEATTTHACRPTSA